MVVACCAFGTCQAVDVRVDLARDPVPENVAIYVGDTITWYATSVVDTESYTGEWKSPILRTGETFSYTFGKPGTFVYRSGWYSESTPPSFYRYFVATITVQPLPNVRPAISIAAPPDDFIFPSFFQMQAVVTNSQANTKAVNFFKEDQLIGTATNSPYQITVIADKLGTFEYAAAVVNTAGLTNFSPRIRVTFDAFKMFNSFRLAGGQFVSFHSAQPGPNCVLWSDDLKTWEYGMIGAGQRLGASTFIDESTTNKVQRFYTIKGCL